MFYIVYVFDERLHSLLKRNERHLLESLDGWKHPPGLVSNIAVA
jgi:hypothetical protein